jgi:acyl-CoA thioester hydrolase
MKYVNKQFVRWDDLDAMTHVNNAKYLTFAQEARFVWSTAVFTSAMNASTLIEMVVARAEVDFIEPIYEGGRFVDVEISVEKIGNSSFNVLYTIRDEEKVFAKVKTVQVAVSLETKRSRPLTDKEREFLTKYLESN